MLEAQNARRRTGGRELTEDDIRPRCRGGPGSTSPGPLGPLRLSMARILIVGWGCRGRARGGAGCRGTRCGGTTRDPDSLAAIAAAGAVAVVWRPGPARRPSCLRSREWRGLLADGWRRTAPLESARRRLQACVRAARRHASARSSTGRPTASRGRPRQRSAWSERRIPAIPRPRGHGATILPPAGWLAMRPRRPAAERRVRAEIARARAGCAQASGSNGVERQPRPPAPGRAAVLPVGSAERRLRGWELDEPSLGHGQLDRSSVLARDPGAAVQDAAASGQQRIRACTSRRSCSTQRGQFRRWTSRRAPRAPSSPSSRSEISRSARSHQPLPGAATGCGAAPCAPLARASASSSSDAVLRRPRARGAGETTSASAGVAL